MKKMKDSGIEWIGQIPEDRKLIRSKYALSYIKGRIPTETNTEQNGVPYIGASDLDNLSGRSEYSIYTRDTDIPVCGYEDILVLWDCARAGLIGRNHMGAISSTIVKIIPNDDIDKRFFFWYLKGFEKYLYECVNGTTIPHMNKKYIEDISMLDWSLDDQIRIADFLDEKCSKIDRYIEKQQQIIDKLKAYKQAVITEAVTKGLDPDVPMKDSGNDTIGRIPQHWSVIKFKYISDAIGDGLHSTPEYDADGDYYFLNGNNIGAETLVFKENTDRLNEVEFHKYKPVNINDRTILITLNGATYGKTSFYNSEKVLLGKSAGYITLKNGENKHFVRLYLQSYVARLIMELSLCGSTIANLSLRTLNEFVMPYPPTNERDEIVDYLSAKCTEIDIVISKKQAVIDKLTEYKKSLIYEAVTGKLEV